MLIRVVKVLGSTAYAEMMARWAIVAGRESERSNKGNIRQQSDLPSEFFSKTAIPGWIAQRKLSVVHESADSVA